MTKSGEKTARSGNRLDDAARAGWLYYVAGRTQDEIAGAMGISRQSAQRLVSLAVSEKLIKVRLDHPIAACLELAEALKRAFDLTRIEVVPSDPAGTSRTVGLAETGAAEVERWLRSETPIVMAVGTGRTLKAAIDQLPAMECPQHRIVSLTGNIGPDGSASYYNVIFSMADAVKARHFPMPLPIFVSSPEERALLHQQAMVQSTLSLARQANVTFVGIGELGPNAPLRMDGFLDEDEIAAAERAGAVGEICGWVFDAEGRLLDGVIEKSVASAPLPPREESLVMALAMGERKRAAIAGALKGRLVNGLVTDEETARHLLRVA
ncbi:sugar-binding transcriptional regulator [Pararhizobium mangrovi]|uniref:Sugar-binding transcriptional regulator n=1 Tax=Pararhizobium mangrovi TaxID=2590452 RepID=A0A506U4C3_9HYPH|nr:sugar-binding transcriptional regulator [Pararhizobium mangrovi]TPW28161.1 sugar-binding transcriptional regulator [Pararhizobium mangrovi]